jgi:vacuolar-type H+-ATPase catalytic subunit A/Vma1
MSKVFAAIRKQYIVYAAFKNLKRALPVIAEKRFNEIMQYYKAKTPEDVNRLLTVETEQILSENIKEAVDDQKLEDMIRIVRKVYTELEEVKGDQDDDFDDQLKAEMGKPLVSMSIWEQFESQTTRA